MKPVYGLALAMGGFALGAGGFYLGGRHSGNTAPAGQSAQQAIYQCPMHSQMTSDHAGDCPICGMKMVLVHKHAPSPGTHANTERKAKFYRSPMSPAQTSLDPRKDEMGMDYVPVYDDEGDASDVAGLAVIRIDPTQQQLIGLRTAEVQAGTVGGTWTTVGRVVADETRVRKVNVKIAGYVERLFADFVGKSVAKGQPLLSLYSPELLSAQKEYLVALRMHKTASGGLDTDTTYNQLLAATRKRLSLWDIPEPAIEQIERTGQPSKSLTLVSPISGAVTAKSVVEGAFLNAGDMPLEITDLSEVWVFADVYESELSRARVGMQATLTLQAFPGRSFKGTVSFIDPVLNPKTRTARVRITFHNPLGELRPDLFGQVAFLADKHQGLRIPTDAVIRSGSRSVVFVTQGDGKFTPREVKVGYTMGDFVEVRSGVQAGEKVVIGANFLLDSEARLEASQETTTAKP
jgi:Cu(I)/Ag(I) efflux system membrane fusion protein